MRCRGLKLVTSVWWPAIFSTWRSFWALIHTEESLVLQMVHVSISHPNCQLCKWLFSYLLNRSLTMKALLRISGMFLSIRSGHDGQKLQWVTKTNCHKISGRWTYITFHLNCNNGQHFLCYISMYFFNIQNWIGLDVGDPGIPTYYITTCGNVNCTLGKHQQLTPPYTRCQTTWISNLHWTSQWLSCSTYL